MNDTPDPKDTPQSTGHSQSYRTHALQDRAGDVWVPVRAKLTENDDLPMLLAQLAGNKVWISTQHSTVERYYGAAIPLCALGSDRVIRKNHFSSPTSLADKMLAHVTCNRCRLFWRHANRWTPPAVGD